MIHVLAQFADAAATGIGDTACKVAGSNAIGCSTNLLDSKNGFVANAIGAVFIIVGAIAVLMVIVGGLRYVLSGGDSAGIKSAKDTVLYALIGLAVTLLSYAIVSFILARVG